MEFRRVLFRSPRSWDRYSCTARSCCFSVFLEPLPTSSSTERQRSGPTRTGSQRTHDCTVSHAHLQPKSFPGVFTPRRPAETARPDRSVPMTGGLYKIAETARNKRPKFLEHPFRPTFRQIALRVQVLVEEPAFVRDPQEIKDRHNHVQVDRKSTRLN